MAKKYEDIENIGKLISGGAIAELSKKVSGAEKLAAEILKSLIEMEKAKAAKKQEKGLLKRKKKHANIFMKR